jgi:hypothetical protein
MSLEELRADLDRRAAEPGPTVTMTKAQYAMLLRVAEAAEALHRAEDALTMARNVDDAATVEQALAYMKVHEARDALRAALLASEKRTLEGG